MLINYFSNEVDNKDTLFTKKEKIINENKKINFSNIPKSCYVELDRVCQNRIIEKIEKINFSSKIFKNLYLDYKEEIGKSENEILKVSDFDTNIELFQELSLKLGSFYNAQLQFENPEILKMNKISLNSEEIEFLAYLEKKIDACRAIYVFNYKLFDK